MVSRFLSGFVATARICERGPTYTTFGGRGALHGLEKELEKRPLVQRVTEKHFTRKLPKLVVFKNLKIQEFSRGRYFKEILFSVNFLAAQTGKARFFRV